MSVAEALLFAARIRGATNDAATAAHWAYLVMDVLGLARHAKTSCGALRESDRRLAALGEAVAGGARARRRSGECVALCSSRGLRV